MTRTEAEARDERLEVDRQRMPYTLDAGLAGRARIGLVVLASDHTIEHEFAHLLGLPGVGIYHSRIANDPEINAETLAAMEQRLTAAADTLLPGVEFDVIAYGCTSASMVIGPDRVHQRIRAARPGAVCTTPMEAALAALAALGVRRIAFVPPYVAAINRRMRRYFIDQGGAVPVRGSWNRASDNDVARGAPARLREAGPAPGARRSRRRRSPPCCPPASPPPSARRCSATWCRTRCCSTASTWRRPAGRRRCSGCGSGAASTSTPAPAARWPRPGSTRTGGRNAGWRCGSRARSAPPT